MRTRHLTSPLVGLLTVAALGSSAYAGASDPAPVGQPAAPATTEVLEQGEMAGEISEQAQVELAPGEDPADWGLE